MPLEGWHRRCEPSFDRTPDSTDDRSSFVLHRVLRPNARAIDYMLCINLSRITRGRCFALEVLSEDKNYRSYSGHTYSTVIHRWKVIWGCLPQYLKFDTTDRYNRTQEPCLGYIKEVLGVMKPRHIEIKPIIELRANIAVFSHDNVLPWSLWTQQEGHLT